MKKHWKTQICGAACALLLAGAVIPGQVGAAPMNEGPAILREVQENQPPFENPKGMNVDLIYFYTDKDGSEKIAGKVERAVIPAGTASVTVEIQKRLMPEGYTLKDPKDLPLQEDTVEVKIQVLAPGEQPEDSKDPTEKPTEPAPTDPKPTEPKPTEPKPTEPKPTEPKPTEPKPTEPSKPAEKPNKPADKPNKKPDTTNPQTGDVSSLGLWITLGLSSAGGLLILNREKRYH